MKLFQDIIEHMDAKNSNHEKHLFMQFLRIPQKAKFQYFLVDFSEKLGEGAYGKVYKAYLLDKTTHDFALTKDGKKRMFAAKFYQLDGKKAHEELKFAKAYYEAYGPIETGSDTWTLTEFIPGNPLILSSGRTNPLIETLSFKERLFLIHQLAVQLHDMHNPTPTHPSPFIHGDISAGNIHIERDDAGLLTGRFLDFGYSLSFQLGQALIRTRRQGTPHFMAPEIMLSRHKGPKSDVYSFAVVCALILGVKRPFEPSKRYGFHEPKHYQGKFTKEMLENAQMHRYPNSIQACLFKFLKKMRCMNYHERVDSEVCLQFFTALLNYTTYHDVDEKHPYCECYLAKILLLANGVYTFIDDRGHTQETERFHFMLQPALCRKICQINFTCYTTKGVQLPKCSLAETPGTEISLIEPKLSASPV